MKNALRSVLKLYFVTFENNFQYKIKIVLDGLGETEIGKLEESVLCEENILGLQIWNYKIIAIAKNRKMWKFGQIINFFGIILGFN